MKKIFKTLILILSPITIFAYSEKIIPGGENIGIEIETNGLVIVGFYKVEGSYIAEENLKVGDTILKIENVDINSIGEMTDLIDENINNNEVNITIKRNNKLLDTKLKLVLVDGVYKTGLYVKEKVTGIGTITYIDPLTNIYGALGHEIVMNETNNNVEVRKGTIYQSFVHGIDRSVNGRVGSKNASIDYSNKLGSILENTKIGIYGIIDKIPEKETLDVAKWEDIKLGDAYILTNTGGDTIDKYKINITNLNKNDIKTNKSISFEVIDEELLELSGGIVQGMSGSPIIQNNKIIGAVTHVVIDEVTKGYAVFIRTMLEEGEN